MIFLFCLFCFDFYYLLQVFAKSFFSEFMNVFLAKMAYSEVSFYNFHISCVSSINFTLLPLSYSKRYLISLSYKLIVGIFVVKYCKVLSKLQSNLFIKIKQHIITDLDVIPKSHTTVFKQSFPIMFIYEIS